MPSFHAFKSFLLPVISGFMDISAGTVWTCSDFMVGNMPSWTKSPLNVTTHANTGLRQFDMYPFYIFLTWAWMTPLPTSASRTGHTIISSPNTPEVSLQRFSWLGTSCHGCHRKREDAIFTHTKLVQFYSVWRAWPSKCQLGPAEPSLHVSRIPQDLAHNVLLWIVKLWLFRWNCSGRCVLLKSSKPVLQKHTYTVKCVCVQV